VKKGFVGQLRCRAEKSSHHGTVTLGDSCEQGLRVNWRAMLGLRSGHAVAQQYLEIAQGQDWPAN